MIALEEKYRYARYVPSKRQDLLHSFFDKGNFFPTNHSSVSYSSEDFDPKNLEWQFSRICDDFLEPLSKTESSASLGFCQKMVYELNPFFRENRVGEFVHVLKFPGDNNVTKKVILLPYRSSVMHEDIPLGMVVTKDGETTLTITLSQGMFLATRTLRKLIDLYPDLILLTPAARAAFVNKARLPKLAGELRMTLAELLKMINCSCISRSGHYLEEADASCALVVSIHSTRAISDQRRRVSLINKLIAPYVDIGAIPLLERAIIFEKYATPE